MKIFNYITASLLLLFSMTACDLIGDIDEIQPEYQLEEGNVIRDAKSAEQTLKGVYSTWRTWGISTYRPHGSILSGALARSGGISGDTGFPTNEVKEDNTAVQDLYTSLYGVINSANYVIELMEAGKAVGMDAVRQSEVIAECKFHRAMAHFMLLRHFGQFYDESSEYGIVLRDKPFRDDQDISERQAVNKCYTFILEDLTTAISQAPEYVSDHYLISRTTAKAYKSRVLLTQKKYAAAAALAAEVIQEANNYGYFMEESDWSNIFSEAWGSTEVLFAPYTYGSGESCSVSIDRTSAGVYTTELAEEWGSLLNENSTEADPRYVRTFLDYSPNGNAKYPYLSYGTGMRNSYLFMRLAEVYLIHAEAAARTSDYTAARNSLKAITGRAGYEDSVVDNLGNNELLEAIRQHKWLELVSENYEEWFDLVRYHIEGDLKISDVKSTILSNHQLILPIPQKALIANKLLKPNPEQ